MKKILKNILGEIPFFPEAYWLLHGSKKPWNAHYQLSGLNTILPQAVEDVKQFGLKASNPKKVGVFATLHYWIEQAILVALALTGQGHDVEMAYLPYAEWDKPITGYDLHMQHLHSQQVLLPAGEVMSIAPLIQHDTSDVSISDYPPELSEIARQVSDYDTQYTLQVEETDKESPLYRLRLERNTAAAMAIYDWLASSQPEVLILPNGTILEMGVAYQVARLLGIRTVTFEFADQRERIWLAQDDEIMSHHTAELWNGLGGQPLPEAARQAVGELSFARKNAKLWGDFARQWQQTPARGASEVRRALGLDERPVALLATNVLGDSLTLGRQRISGTMAEMIVGTIRWFLNHPEAQLVIRVHPGELKTHGTSMVEVIEQAFPALPEHIHLVRPEDKTNTYDLVETADFGIVYTTTVGLEMAMSGLPVAVTGLTHYAEKGFTLDPADWQDFESILSRLAADPASMRLSQQQVEQAWLYAYLFFFEFSLPFPWHLLWLHEDFEARPMRFVLSPEGQEKYAQTFGYLAGEPLDWAARGLARLPSLSEKEETHQ
ncbi:MAG: hypothetical protein KBA05_01320 [Anaerolineaceae bacterium]|jgi:hypothetical protein|nr:hypothetical protein [Anaerolineaceae bacterium]MDI9531636.1 hypothetical protein [Chloroflexota bacterium]HNZ16505.1 hypothetical protein [Anaerolineaceae bacterium]HOF27800.1 hypothetical protein [Anaerolineaceae bacterium]